jgi:uncharacterized membrane protein
MNQAAGTIAPVAVGALAEPFGIPLALLASAVFSIILLGASMARHARRDEPRLASPGPSLH